MRNTKRIERLIGEIKNLSKAEQRELVALIETNHLTLSKPKKAIKKPVAQTRPKRKVRIQQDSCSHSEGCRSGGGGCGGGYNSCGGGHGCR